MLATAFRDLLGAQATPYDNGDFYHAGRGVHGGHARADGHDAHDVRQPLCRRLPGHRRRRARQGGIRRSDGGPAPQRGRVDEALLPKAASVNGVAAPRATIYGYARLVAKNGKALGNPANGAPARRQLDRQRALNQFRLVEGTPPQRDNEVVIDRKSSRDGHLAVGDTTTVLVQGPPLHVRIAGVARFGDGRLARAGQRSWHSAIPLHNASSPSGQVRRHQRRRRQRRLAD